MEKKKKIKERARKRQSTLNNQETAPAHLSVSEQQQDIGETMEIVSKKVGISRGTYDYSSFISFNGL